MSRLYNLPDSAGRDSKNEQFVEPLSEMHVFVRLEV